MYKTFNTNKKVENVNSADSMTICKHHIDKSTEEDSEVVKEVHVVNCCDSNEEPGTVFYDVTATG